MNQNDTRYQKTETALEESFLKSIKQGYSKLTPAEIAKNAGVSRTTFYRHCKNADEIYRRQKHRFIHQSKRIIEKLTEKNLSDQTVVYNLLLHFYRNRKFLELDLCYCNCQAVLSVLKSLDIKNIRKSKTNEERNVLFFAIVGLLKNWQENHFYPNQIADLAAKIVLQD